MESPYNFPLSSKANATNSIGSDTQNIATSIKSRTPYLWPVLWIINCHGLLFRLVLMSLQAYPYCFSQLLLPLPEFPSSSHIFQPRSRYPPDCTCLYQLTWFSIILSLLCAHSIAPQVYTHLTLYSFYFYYTSILALSFLLCPSCPFFSLDIGQSWLFKTSLCAVLHHSKLYNITCSNIILQHPL